MRKITIPDDGPPISYGLIVDTVLSHGIVMNDPFILFMTREQYRRLQFNNLIDHDLEIFGHAIVIEG